MPAFFIVITDNYFERRLSKFLRLRILTEGLDLAICQANLESLKDRSKSFLLYIHSTFLTDHASVLALNRGFTSAHVDWNSSEVRYFSSAAASSHTE